MKIGRKTLTQRARGFLLRPLRWFAKPLGRLGKPLSRLAKPLGKIDGIEKPAVYLGFAFVLWRLWVDQRSRGATPGRGPSPMPPVRRRRPSLRLAVQERWARAAGRRAEDHESRPNP